MHFRAIIQYALKRGLQRLQYPYNIGHGIYILSYLLNFSMKSLHSFFVGKVI